MSTISGSPKGAHLHLSHLSHSNHTLMAPQKEGSFLHGLRECCERVSTVGPPTPAIEPPSQRRQPMWEVESGQGRRSSRGNITTIDAEESNFRQLVLEHTSPRPSCPTDPALGILQSPHVLRLLADLEIVS